MHDQKGQRNHVCPLHLPALKRRTCFGNPEQEYCSANLCTLSCKWSRLGARDFPEGSEHPHVKYMHRTFCVIPSIPNSCTHICIFWAFQVLETTTSHAPFPTGSSKGGAGNGALCQTQRAASATLMPRVFRGPNVRF